MSDFFAAITIGTPAGFESCHIYYNMWPLFRKLVSVVLISKYFENRAFLPIAINKHVYLIKSHNL